MSDNKNNDPRSLAMFVLSMLIFGTIGVFRRYLPVSSAFLAFSRGMLGSLFLLLFMKLTGKGRGERLSLRQTLWLALSGAAMGINWILLFEAYNYTTVAVATLCYYMQPTIVMLLSPLIFREKLTGKKVLCAVIAVGGMILVSGVTGAQSAGKEGMRGILLGLGAALFYSIVIIMNKKAPGLEAYRKTTVQLFSAGLVMIPYLLLTGGKGEGPFTPATVLLLAVVGLVHTGVAYVLYFGSMDGLRTQSIAIFSYIDPVSALIFSAVFLREPLTPMNLIGALMIIGSAVASEWRSTEGKGG